jgi:hypothetical protein
MNHWFGDKSLVERPYSTKFCLPSKTAQKLYKTTRKGKMPTSLSLELELTCAPLES